MSVARDRPLTEVAPGPRRLRRGRRRRTAGAVLALALALICGGGSGSGACSEEARTTAAGWLAEARRLSSEADAASTRNDPVRARQALQALLADPRCGGLAPADCRWLRQDALARLGEHELVAGQPAAALAVADRGLALGLGEDLPSATLLALRGRALEGLGRDSQAAAAYQQALQLDERLLARALARPDGGNR